MSSKRTAIVSMEEGYMRASIEYDDFEYKADICKAITGLEKKLDIYPEVIYRIESEKKGFCSVEFSGDEYICSRSCGDFIEELLSTLDIKECVTD